MLCGGGVFSPFFIVCFVHTWFYILSIEKSYFEQFVAWNCEHSINPYFFPGAPPKHSYYPGKKNWAFFLHSYYPGNKNRAKITSILTMVGFRGEQKKEQKKVPQNTPHQLPHSYYTSDTVYIYISGCLRTPIYIYIYIMCACFFYIFCVLSYVSSWSRY